MTARLEIELRELNVFVIVTDSSSMTGAAARLGMTQSAVSQVITKLEGHLGAKLLDRSVRPISVTNAGHTFYERAVSILEQA